MGDAETFKRGTIRFKGFSWIISAFHDVGLTSDDQIPAGVTNLRELTMWRLSQVKEPTLQADEKEIMYGVCRGMTGADLAMV